MLLMVTMPHIFHLQLIKIIDSLQYVHSIFEFICVTSTMVKCFTVSIGILKWDDFHFVRYEWISIKHVVKRHSF